MDKSSSASATYTLTGDHHVSEHFFDVPLNHDNLNHGTIQCFAKIIKKHEVSVKANSKPKDDEDNSQYLLYLQGGPGFQCGPSNNSSYLPIFLDKGYHVILLDQRGTGLSTCISPTSIPGTTDEEQADYLALFRADSIVKDCEVLRRELIGEDAKWSLIGQSFGGFCIVNYLSFYGSAVTEVFMFGGIPPILEEDPDEVYQRLYKKVAARNAAYYKKYPQDIHWVHTILAYLQDKEVVFPDGGHLSNDRFRELGLMLGGHGGIDELHQLILRAATDLQQHDEILIPTLLAIQAAQSFDTNIIYALLHEALYCQNGKISEWSAERTLIQADRRFVSLGDPNIQNSPDEAAYFTGEMIYPSMFDDYASLKPLKGVAHVLASRKWDNVLYDVEQIKHNTVPIYAATYMNDMYVDFDLTRQFAEVAGNFHEYVTNEYMHNALRTHASEVVKALFSLRNGVVD